jgi:hypothetical protein
LQIQYGITSLLIYLTGECVLVALNSGRRSVNFREQSKEKISAADNSNVHWTVFQGTHHSQITMNLKKKTDLKNHHRYLHVAYDLGG